MNGIHDLGGMDGFGTVEPEPDEPVFHARWEAKVMAMMRAMGASGAWSTDAGRASVEALPPSVYLTSSYYRRWALGLEQLLLDRGLVDPEELAAGRASRPGRSLLRKLTAESAVQLFSSAREFSRPTTSPPRFKPGDDVRARNIHPLTHTRLPRYVRGRVGVVEANLGCTVFPDSVAVDAGDDPQWLYTVRLAARELWGPDADPTVSNSVDAFEPYLEPA